MPGAWEIVEARRNRVMVVTIAPPDLKVTTGWASAVLHLALPPMSDFMMVKGFPFGPARNKGLKEALDQGYGWLFFLDADVICPPNVVMDLLANGRDLIGGLYYRRFPPYEPAPSVAVRNEGGQLLGHKPPSFNHGDVIPVEFLPMGATLISRRCMETVLASHPRPFEWNLDIDTQDRGGLSEDFTFSLRALELGFQPWVATGLTCRHETLTLVGPRGLEYPAT